jgi:hypothetical protein
MLVLDRQSSETGITLLSEFGHFEVNWARRDFR